MCRQNKIQTCRDGAKMLVDKISESKLLSNTVELGLIVFNEYQKTIIPIAPVEPDVAKNKIEAMEADGLTDIGNAYFAAKGAIEEREKTLKQTSSVHLLKSAIVMLSDGIPEGHDENALKAAASDAASACFNTIPVLVGDNNGPTALDDFGNVIHISDSALTNLFDGILNSTKVSVSTSCANAFSQLLAASISWSTAVLDTTK